MATGKRYYWIKLKETFMTSDSVDFLMSQPNGAQYVVLYQMLCLKTINTDGKLTRQIGEIIIPYDIDKIERDCKWFSQDTIRVALNLYKSLGLIYQDTDGTLVMADHNNLVGSETDYAKQKKLQRTKKQLLLDVDNSVDNVHIDNRDKILDIRDKSIDNKILDNNVKSIREKLTDKEIEMLSNITPHIQLVLEQIDKKIDANDIKHPYEYIIKVLEEGGWK